MQNKGPLSLSNCLDGESSGGDVGADGGVPKHEVKIVAAIGGAVDVNVHCRWKALVFSGRIWSVFVRGGLLFLLTVFSGVGAADGRRVYSSSPVGDGEVVRQTLGRVRHRVGSPAGSEAAGAHGHYGEWRLESAFYLHIHRGTEA